MSGPPALPPLPRFQLALSDEALLRAHARAEETARALSRLQQLRRLLIDGSAENPRDLVEKAPTK